MTRDKQMYTLEGIRLRLFINELVKMKREAHINGEATEFL